MKTTTKTYIERQTEIATTELIRINGADDENNTKKLPALVEEITESSKRVAHDLQSKIYAKEDAVKSSKTELESALNSAKPNFEKIAGLKKALKVAKAELDLYNEISTELFPKDA